MIGGDLLPYPVCVVSEGLVLFLPEDLWEWDSRHTTLKTHRVTLSDTCVLEFLNETWGFMHLFG